MSGVIMVLGKDRLFKLMNCLLGFELLRAITSNILEIDTPIIISLICGCILHYKHSLDLAGEYENYIQQDHNKKENSHGNGN